ncbi:MAG TPA: hypothetical protein PKD20_02830, partial [Candidatus Saccharibacteria bacterium]|nr:hypothetical protein [Candidatus Saccharibacteria bacterium]
MFQKLVANLPFNPSLINQLVFYTDRLKRERTIRAASSFLILFAMALQMFAVIVPPEKSLAASDNHILDGLSTAKTPQQNKDFLLQNWDANEDIRAIYGAFGVTRDDIASMENKTVTIFSGNADYWTTGRNSLLSYSNVAQQYKDTQIAIQYIGQNTATTSDDRFVYQRQLKAWDIVNKTGNYYVALQGKIASTGETFWIFYDCGNFTKLGKYTPPPPPPTTPINPLSAACSLIGPVVIGASSTTAQIPVRITLPAGSSVPKGSSDATGEGRGLHLSVTTNGSPATWDKYKNEDLTSSPPDNQSDYISLADGTSGVSYYEFNWRDGHTYRRYYVTDAQSSNFQVTLNVRINSLDRKLVVRLLDRELGQWLPHNSSCEVAISREVPPPPEVPTPALEIKKTIVDKPNSLKPGDSYTYLINYRNTVNASVAENVII